MSVTLISSEVYTPSIRMRGMGDVSSNAFTAERTSDMLEHSMPTSLRKDMRVGEEKEEEEEEEEEEEYEEEEEKEEEYEDIELDMDGLRMIGSE